jgi:hypothetical protein
MKKRNNKLPMSTLEKLKCFEINGGLQLPS